MTERELIDEGLRPLFARAEKEGLWFHSGYQDLWFSPKRLRELQQEGRFLWGAVNWTLRNPQEHVNELSREIKSLIQTRDEFVQMLEREKNGTSK